MNKGVGIAQHLHFDTMMSASTIFSVFCRSVFVSHARLARLAPSPLVNIFIAYMLDLLLFVWLLFFAIVSNENYQQMTTT